MSGPVLKESVGRHKDGHLVPVELNIAPILDGTRNITGLSVIIRDISERKRTEARLAEREAQLALFVEHAPAGKGGRGVEFFGAPHIPPLPTLSDD